MTTNIYYNYSMLDGSLARNTSALYTFSQKYSVCEGYANLTAAMCQYAGIPCRKVTGFAIGTGVDEEASDVWGLYDRLYIKGKDLAAFKGGVASYANHAWNEAYVDGRWVIMDCTWGSNNDMHLMMGTQGQGLGTIKAPPTDKYFDISIADISETHVFWTDYSSDMRLTASGSNALGASLTLDDADYAKGRKAVFASYDKNGKMLECGLSEISGKSLGQVFGRMGEISSIKLFVSNSSFKPVAEIYRGSTGS